MSKKQNCYICFGWGVIHPLDTGKKLNNGEPLVVWCASMGAHEHGSIDCPACNGSGVAKKPEPKMFGEIVNFKIYF